MIRKLLVPMALLFTLALTGCQKDSTDKSESAAAAPKSPPPAPPKPRVLLQVSFAGISNVISNTNGAFINKLTDLPSSKRLGAQTANRLSDLAGKLLAGPDQQKSGLTPLLNDVWKSRSFTDVRALSNSAPIWVVGAEVGSEGSQFWQAQLSSILSETNAPATETNGAQRLAFSQSSGTNRVQWLKQGNWSLIASGTSAADNEALADALKAIQSGNSPIELPAGAWLAVTADVGGLNERAHWLEPGPWPTVNLKVFPKNQRLRIEETWTSSQAMVAELTPWTVPVQTIHDDPLASFTAIRGLSPLLKLFPLVKNLEIEDLVDQVFFWSEEANPPIMEYLALKSAGGSNRLERLASKLPRFLEQAVTNSNAGEIGWATNRSGLVWEGLPVVLPFARPVEEPAGGFLVAGMWPILPTKNQFPAPLLEQFTTKSNLVYYHWESTGSRIKQARAVSQLMAYVASPYNTSTNVSAGDAWLDEIAPLLERTVVESIAQDPHTIQTTRISQLGFDAKNLVRLAAWLDHTNFPFSPPRFVYDPPVELRRKTTRAPKPDTTAGKTNTPASSAPSP